jgi:hypothetical protein
VDVGSGTIRDNILPLPYKEPSSVLYQLLGNIVDEGRRFASTADMNVSDMSANAPVGTTLALLERQLKVMTAVQARVHFALKQELKLLKNLIRDYTDADYTYEPEYGSRKAKRGDYDLVDLIPVSDPNAATMSQRVIQYQAVIQMAQMAPDIYDLPQLHRGMLDVLGIKNADKLVPIEEDMKPVDPVSENQAALNGKPMKAFMYQNHDAHIQVHMMLLQDPMMQQLIGQNPQAPKIMGAITAHIAEHAGYKMRQQIEQQLGMPMPPEDEKLPPQIEVALSGMLAQAAQQVTQQNQAQAAQQQAQQQAQDPVVQMQMQELQIKAAANQLKEADLKLKATKIAADAALNVDKLKLEEKKVSGNLQVEAMRIGAMTKNNEAQLASQQKRDGVRMGIDIAKARAQEQANARKDTLQHITNFSKSDTKK